MSNLNKTPSSNRLHISIFGKRNMGKSTLINAITGQNLAIVSEVAGTTTDPIYKAMEISPIGPCILIDTAGIDDIGALGELRISKTMEIVRKTDIAILTTDYNGFTKFDLDIIKILEKNNIPFIVVLNKSDLQLPAAELLQNLDDLKYPYISLSAEKKDKIEDLKNLIIKYSPQEFESPTILGDLIEPGDHIVLVIPIDTGMPKGRIILPQVQTMRDILDHSGIIHTCKDTELEATLEGLKNPPKLVITDSQAFERVSKIVPESVMLTSFSILFARYKGDLKKMVEGAKTLISLKEGDKFLVSEACTHHVQKDDIGRYKIPKWIGEKIDSNIEFDVVAGRDYPENLKDYKLVIHCGGCTLNRKEMLARINISYREGVPILNYGLCIATLFGILDRALKPFPEVNTIWEGKKD
jgi:[FeFe] hydrogenase H-cluster maturation GTPase HydF